MSGFASPGRGGGGATTGSNRGLRFRFGSAKPAGIEAGALRTPGAGRLDARLAGGLRVSADREDLPAEADLPAAGDRFLVVVLAGARAVEVRPARVPARLLVFLAVDLAKAAFLPCCRAGCSRGCNVLQHNDIPQGYPEP